MWVWSIAFMMIPLLVLVVCVVGLIILWCWVFLPGLGKGRGDALARCGGCGYGVRGVEHLNCPECGGDLREVGIVTPKRKGMVPPWVFILLWTLLLPLPALVLSVVLVMVGPSKTVTYENLMLAPKSAQYASITISSGGYMTMDWWWGSGDDAAAHQLDIYGSGNAAEWMNVQVDLRTLEYNDLYSTSVTTTPGAMTSNVAVDGSGTSHTLDQAAVLDWLESLGADVQQDAVIAEADDLLAILKSAAASGFSAESAQTSGFIATPSSWDDSIPSLWFMAIQPLLWLAVWVLGIVLFFRVRRRHVAAFAETPNT